ncbi:MAG: hypothetical protein ACOC5T_07220 [Elusimicrobiota bacterium]
MEEKLIFFISDAGKFTAKQIGNISRMGGPLEKYNRNSIYNALKILEEKGFIKNYGRGKVEYKLTKLGEVQARWLKGTL